MILKLFWTYEDIEFPPAPQKGSIEWDFTEDAVAFLIRQEVQLRGHADGSVSLAWYAFRGENDLLVPIPNFGDDEGLDRFWRMYELERTQDHVGIILEAMKHLETCSWKFTAQDRDRYREHPLWDEKCEQVAENFLTRRAACRTT